MLNCNAGSHPSGIAQEKLYMAIKVLIAEDHQLVRQGLTALLEKEGFTVVAEAANGQEL